MGYIALAESRACSWQCAHLACLRKPASLVPRSKTLTRMHS